MSARTGSSAGASDLFHVGHLYLLAQASQHCDYVIAGVVSDELLETTTSREPVVSLAGRLEIGRNIRCVDEAVTEVHPSRPDTWWEHPFNIFFKGDDWRGTEKGISIEPQLAGVGVEVTYFPYAMHTSSTVAAGTWPGPGFGRRRRRRKPRIATQLQVS